MHSLVHGVIGTFCLDLTAKVKKCHFEIEQDANKKPQTDLSMAKMSCDEIMHELKLVHLLKRWLRSNLITIYEYFQRENTPGIERLFTIV